MIFSSTLFLFIFLPVTLLVYYLIPAKHLKIRNIALLCASLIFYAWGEPKNIILMLASIACNYIFGLLIGKFAESSGKKKLVLVASVVFNLGMLGYFKYWNLFTFGKLWEVALPIGISFYTFQIMSYVIDVYRGEVAVQRSPFKLGLYISLFPQLIAGPIVHHREMLPQFAHSDTYRPQSENLAVGLTIFTIGLFKKVVIADGIAPYVSPVFDAASAGQSITFFEAWGGALAYTLQLYFDFSGYSDMAIGLGRMFGIRLPINFNSPYKANNIIDFWRRWHITLSRFLRDYLYIPLGGSRNGHIQRHRNLLITMLLGGLWHGAGWTFIVWGGLHGIYLVINHAWRALRQNLKISDSGRIYRWTARLLTLTAIVVAWVFFRAENFDTAMRLLTVMFGGNGIVIAPDYAEKLGFLQGIVVFAPFNILSGSTPYTIIVILLIAVWSLPNTQQFMANYQPAIGVPAEGTAIPRLVWRPSRRWSLLTSALLLASILMLTRISEFLYFRF